MTNEQASRLFEVRYRPHLSHTTQVRQCETEAEIGAAVVELFNMAGKGSWWNTGPGVFVSVSVVPRGETC